MGMHYVMELALEVASGTDEDPEGVPVGEIVFGEAHNELFTSNWHWIAP
jgi:hypothetical protein